MAIVTISRGTFSGGKALARRLAEALDYPCLSREDVLNEAADAYGISREELDAAMNEPPPFWREMPGRRVAYLKCVTSALCERAKGGNLVYHGHAGHLLLRGISHVLRVRVIMDMDLRITAAMDRLGVGREEARAFIYRIDRERERWIRFLYGIDWHNAGLYDAVLDVGRLGIEGACKSIIGMTELDHFKPTEESEKVFSDLALNSRVWAALARDPRTRGARVKVASDNGKVCLTGSVPSEAVMDALSDVARGVRGVWHVRTEVGIGSDWYW